MSAAVFDLDLEVVPATDSVMDDMTASPEVARQVDENFALTPTTVNTYAVGLGMCHMCC